MKQSTRNDYNKMKEKILINYEDLIVLNDYDLILINNSFLNHIIGYHQLIEKYTNEISSIINDILKNNELNQAEYQDYSIITVSNLKKLLLNMPKSSLSKTAFIKVEKKNFTSLEAFKLLTKDVINDKKDLFKDENKWILHSLYVGMAAGRIAAKLNLDSNHARALGYIHDIGRKIDHNNHLIEGYYFMLNNDFGNEAKICLTHSFIDNNINLTAGGGPKNLEVYEFINNFLKQNTPTVYDNIIQLCDLFCLETGFTTIEKRILDISNRKGVYDNSEEHFNKVLELKDKLEKIMGCKLYSLFPDISPDDINCIQENYEELNKLFNKNVKKYIVK